MAAAKKTSKSKKDDATGKTRIPNRRGLPIAVPQSSSDSVLVVGVGISAGGLSAFTGLLEALPVHPGLAFVLVRYPELENPKKVCQLLSKSTPISIVETTDGLVVEADHVYINPPEKDTVIRGGVLRLVSGKRKSASQHPIDDFYKVLAEDRKSAAIGVVLSGEGSDGALGLNAIRAQGGLTFAQDPKSAECSAMPLNAISNGGVDFVLPLRRIAEQLVRLGNRRESRHFTEALLESAEQAIVAVGSDDRILMINRAVERMFSYRRNEIVGQPFGLLFSEGIRPRHSKYLHTFTAALGKRPKSLSLELEGRRKVGTAFPVSVTVSIIQHREHRLSVAYITDLTETKRLQKLSDQYRQEIVALAAQLMKAQDEERRRVSRELHDSLCQQLASLAFAVEDLATEATPGSLQSRLRALQGGIIKVSEEARHMAYELHPSVLDDLGLVASVRGLCEDFAKNKNVEVTFTASDATRRIPKEVASGLYGVAREGLQNIAKHAKATRVSVELAISKLNIGLSVKDDGLGFDPGAIKRKGGLGIVSMGERARMIGGTFSIEAEPKQGVRIGVIVPLVRTSR